VAADETDSEFESPAEVVMHNPPAPVIAAAVPAPAPVSAPAPLPVASDEPAFVAARPASAHEARAPRERNRSQESYSEPAMTTEELAETSKRLTENLLKAMGFEATVTVAAEADRADVTVEVAQDDELLTGQKGEVRQALQHLLNRFLNRGEGSRYHLQLEINDFWKRREDELASLARSLAEEALTSNAEMMTEYLNSQERRIVHVTLREDTRVKTYALGTGMIKRVAVAPADFPERTGEEDAG
jgi:spoIIIJ-associated protein